jgi:CopG family nickel-responsive transcriptional regulator
MSTSAVSDRKVDHLGREDKRPHDAHQRNLVMVKFPLRSPRNVSDRGERYRVHRSPHRNTQEPVRNVHASNSFHGITFVQIVPRHNVPMSELARIGVAIDSLLLQKFDALIEERGYANRSEAFRDLIREELVQKSWESPDSDVVGTVTLVYDHHVRMLNEKLTDMQHDHHKSILCTTHVHLDHDNCVEVLVVRGKAKNVQKIADGLISTKGVKHGRLTLTTTGAEL